MLEVRHFSFDDNELEGSLPYSNPLIPITYEELKNNYKQPNYIAFDGLGIDLTDDNKVFYDCEYAGFISKTASDEEGHGSGVYMSFTIPETPPKNITLLFYGDCCEKMYVQHTVNTEEISGEYIYPKNGIAVIPINPYAEGLRIEITRTTLPHQLVKLQSIIMGTVNSFKKFRSYSMLEEINILSSDLPMNSFECEVITDEEFNEDEPLNIYSNNTYYGTFFIYEIERTQKKAYLLKCYSPLSFADRTNFDGWDYTVVSTIEALNSFSNACGTEISSLSSKNLEEEDSSIESGDGRLYKMFGNIPNSSVRYNLCATAFVNCMMVSTSRDYGIRLIDIPKNVSSIINSNRILGKATFKKTKTVTSAIWQYPLYYDELEKTVTITSVEGQRTRINFDKPFIVFNVEELNNNFEIYSLSLNHIDFIPVAGETVLKGYELAFVNKEITITNPNTTEKNKENTISFKDFILQGEYSYETIDKSDDIEKYISSRGTVSAKIILNGEKVGDLVTIETELDGMITGIITSLVPKFGYRDTAEIEVYEWPVG